ncbi:cupin domain-containing protein [Jiulongibacter sediminis]|uniref:Cupin n=1 Tax=Jiulongibacter sediminis TaxID=1605367 RepID=A0A0P7BPS3_9BACT|nr:cupin domain-containing protein [Jiulongibacter sediminis]KPM47238.1 cupin [Jiulongibacter sediminis]TBX22797.1 cupin [Jiulongibacter sediminis]
MVTLIEDSQIPWEELGGGIKRKIMAYNEQMMIVKVAFEKGGVGAMHSHPHTQASYVESGVFELTIGDEVKNLKAGDAYFVPSDVEHGAVCLQDGVLIDVFTPRREDFL